LLNHDRFTALVEDAHRRRSEQLPQLNAQIEEHEKELKAIDNGIATARLRLVDPETTAKAANFWMMEIEAYRDQKDRKGMDLEYLYRLREEILTKDNLAQFESLSLELLKTYDRQPLGKKRNVIDRLVKRIVIEDNNLISIHLLGVSVSTLDRSVNHAERKFEWKEHGSSGRARTADQVINSHLLYQLSY
jgi:hypothetical protein